MAYPREQYQYPTSGSHYDQTNHTRQYQSQPSTYHDDGYNPASYNGSPWEAAPTHNEDYMTTRQAERPYNVKPQRPERDPSFGPSEQWPHYAQTDNTRTVEFGPHSHQDDYYEYMRNHDNTVVPTSGRSPQKFEGQAWNRPAMHHQQRHDGYHDPQNFNHGERPRHVDYNAGSSPRIHDAARGKTTVPGNARGRDYRIDTLEQKPQSSPNQKQDTWTSRYPRGIDPRKQVDAERQQHRPHGPPNPSKLPIPPFGTPHTCMPARLTWSLDSERMRMDPTSPQTISWDNPFPTFPLLKKKSKVTGDEDLSRSMNDVTLNDNSSLGSNATSRPSTAGNPTSHAMPVRNADAVSQQRTSAESNGPSHRNQPYRPALDQSITPQQSNAWDRLRPPLDYGRHSEDAMGEPSTRQPASDLDLQRSRTMPSAVSEAMVEHHPSRSHWQGQNTQYNHHSTAASALRRGAEPRLHSGSSRPPGLPQSRSAEAHPVMYPNRDPMTRGPSEDPYNRNPAGFFNATRPTPPDHEYETGKGNVNHQYRRPSDEAMPSFNMSSNPRAGRKRGMTIDDHLQTQQSTPALPPLPPESRSGLSGGLQAESKPTGGFARSKSSPNLQEQSVHGSPGMNDGFNFELPGSVPAMYDVTTQSGRGHTNGTPRNEEFYSARNGEHQHIPSERRPQDFRHQQRPMNSPNMNGPHGRDAAAWSPGAQTQEQFALARAPPNQYNTRPHGEPGSTRDVERTTPRAGLAKSPDALPAHPAPVRAGLMHGPSSNQPARPPPIRQYSDRHSPLQEGASTPRPQISQIPHKEEKSAEVTSGELERLRQACRTNPANSQTQLLLAKKLAEAASVLADEGGRADPKTIQRNRERFILDAQKLVKRLAQDGYAEAAFYYGDCYSRGSLGLVSDAKEAFSYYQTAAKAGHPQAAYRVAVSCELGLEEGGGTKRDAVKAIQWYHRAATLGDTAAMYKLGIIQLKGLLGQSRDPKAALTWLQKAAKQADKDNPHALHELALLYEAPSGNGVIHQDEAYAKQLFTESANLGYKFSQFRLGSAFEYGLLGCSISPRQSIAWYSKAAVQNEHQSELALSGWYLTGAEGVLQQSDTEAYLWARKAAQAGLAKAEYAMGYFTEVGIGASANIEDAKRWYWRSASQNFPKARDRLEDLRRGGAKMQKTRVSRSKINKQSEGECVVM
ncbi:MAG: hypothetical protein Q9220_000033 [cf. Caloplaca sp. 1 TL-2023]